APRRAHPRPADAGPRRPVPGVLPHAPRDRRARDRDPAHARRDRPGRRDHRRAPPDRPGGAAGDPRRRRGARGAPPVTVVWATIGLLCLGTIAIKAAGPLVLGDRKPRGRALAVIALLSPAV